MKMKVIFLLFIMMLIFSNSVNAKSATSLIKLDKAADEALQLTKLGHYAEAKNILENFSENFTELTKNGQFLSMDDMRILLVAQKEALETITNINRQPEEKINKVTSFRLVVDAMISHYQPLWTELQFPLMTAFSQVKEAVKDKNIDSYHVSLNTFLSQYELIQPSLEIDLPVNKLQRINSAISFIDKNRTKIIQDDSSFVQLETLEADLQKVFEDMSEDETDPSIWWVIISTGSIIILTLSYVGWRKYNGEKQTKQKGHND